jgi:type II secretory pathway component GspD/PulD (secretin)
MRRVSFWTRSGVRNVIAGLRGGVLIGVALVACQSRSDPVPHPEPPLVDVVAPPASEPSAPASAAPRAPGPERYEFDFVDADLPELVRLISSITGKRFLYTGQIPHLHATVRSPQPLTREEAYAAFLTILRANGLTIVPRPGGVNDIVPSASLINR